MLERLHDFAAARDRSLVDLAFAWLLAHPAVSSVIAGVSSVEQATENAAASAWDMSRQERDDIDAIMNSMVTRTILRDLDTSMATRAVVRLSRQVEITLSQSQLSVAQFRVLDRLSGGSAAGRSLAEWLAVKPPSITALVDGLVARGLVARTVDEADRRRVTHELTQEGRDLHRSVSDALTARLNELVAHLDDAAVAADTLAALARWNEALDHAREAKRAARREDGG